MPIHKHHEHHTSDTRDGCTRSAAGRSARGCTATRVAAGPQRRPGQLDARAARRRLTATPASEIPLDKFKLPPGFKAEIWATGMPGARAMARGDSGKIYIGTRGIGRVYEVTDTGGAAHQPRRRRQAGAACGRRRSRTARST